MTGQANTATPILMPKRSRYAGLPADVSMRRSIELQICTLNEDRAVFDYFFHEGEYWRATMPLDGVESIFGHSMNFSNKKMKQGKDGPEPVVDEYGFPVPTVTALNHLQTRFVLKPGEYVHLYPLGADATGPPQCRVNDFIYSLENVAPQGVGYNLRDGFWGNFLAAHRFVSTTDVVFERIVVQDYDIVESPPIPLSEQEKRAALTESLKRSHRAGMHETYYLFHILGTNNCTSVPFHILDQVRTYSFWQRVGTMLYRLPLNPRWYLRIRGVKYEPADRKLLRNEMQEYINDPRTQQRKRDYTGAQQK
jgi:hypothetical protein